MNKSWISYEQDYYGMNKLWKVSNDWWTSWTSNEQLVNKSWTMNKSCLGLKKSYTSNEQVKSKQWKSHEQVKSKP